jgi:hypothetical protein
MAAWKNLTSAEKKRLDQALRKALTDRGIDVASTDLEAAGLAGRYRLYVVSQDFSTLDYSDRLAILGDSIKEAWDRFDQLRITLQFPLAPDEVPATPRKPVRSSRKVS